MEQSYCKVLPSFRAIVSIVEICEAVHSEFVKTLHSRAISLNYVRVSHLFSCSLSALNLNQGQLSGSCCFLVWTKEAGRGLGGQ